MCVMYVVLEGCLVPRTLKCLGTPSLEDEEVLLGWSDMVEWGILKKEFNIMSDLDMEKDLVDKGKVSKSSVSAVPSPSTSLPVKQDVEAVEEQLQGLKEEMLWEFHDVFVDELGEADRIAGDPVKLEVLDTDGLLLQCQLNTKRKRGGWWRQR